MRCAVCGGEIDNETKRCKRCGECWGGGNYSVAQSLMSEKQDEYIAPESRTVKSDSKIRDFLFSVGGAAKSAYFAVDDKLAPAADRVLELLRSRRPVLHRANENSAPRRDRGMVYLAVLLITALLLVTVITLSTSCAAKTTLRGRWSLAGTEEQSRVVMEFASGGKVRMYIGSDSDRHLYKEGSYLFNDGTLKINYSDGSELILETELENGTAVFRDPVTGKQQTYIKH